MSGGSRHINTLSDSVSEFKARYYCASILKFWVYLRKRYLCAVTHLASRWWICVY